MLRGVGVRDEDAAVGLAAGRDSWRNASSRFSGRAGSTVLAPGVPAAAVAVGIAVTSPASEAHFLLLLRPSFDSGLDFACPKKRGSNGPALSTGAPLLGCSSCRGRFGFCHPNRGTLSGANVATVGHSSTQGEGRTTMSGIAEALPSWRDTPTRQSIVDFVAAVTDRAVRRIRTGGRPYRGVRQ